MVVAVIFLATGSASAQLSAGAILGSVGDASGALIPGVSVTVTNEGTNQSREGLTNETGNYRIEPLQAASYTVTVELPGFRTEVRRGVIVNVGARVRMDFLLAVGQVTEVIEVSAEAPIVQTDDSQVGAVMDLRKIVELPLNGRNFSALAYLTPGTFAPRPGSHLSDRGGFVAAGLEEKTNQLLVDGVNNNGAGTMEAAYRVNIDTVGEFKIQTQNYTAQYGRYAGAQVDAITKSGTNEVHGSAFAFTRNDNLDARNFFDAWPLESKPEFKRHQYGATIGGPIVQDKAFFFFGFQGQRQTFSRRTSPTVPFPEYWQGDLSRIPQTITDPETGLPFPNNQIPVDRLDPTALKFEPFFTATPNKNTLARNANALLEEPEHFWQPDVKINYQMNDSHGLMFSWGYYNSDLLEWRIAGRPELPNYMMFGQLKNQRFALAYTWTVSPTVVNEVRGGLSRVRRIRLPFLRDRNYAREVFGIEGTVGDVDPIGYAVPELRISGFSNISTAGTQPRADGNWSIADTVSIIRGNHALKFGGDVFRQYMNLTVLSNQAGEYRFSGGVTGHAFADFLLGFADQTSRAFPLGPLSQHPNRWSSNWFFQDDWKVSNTFTLNYGVRWEYLDTMKEKWGRLATFDPTLGGGVGGIRVVASGIDNGARYDEAVARYKALNPGVIVEKKGELYNADKNNWAPRLGFAWNPDFAENFVVRGGYGLFFTIDDLCLCGHYNLSPFMLTQNFRRAQNPTWDNPFPSVPGGTSAAAINPDYPTPYFGHWNLGVQYELPLSVALDVSYVGKKGTRLDGLRRDINQPVDGVRPYPLFGPISFIEARGNSNFHGLQTRIERRMASGMNVLVSYLFSRMIDDDAQNDVRDANNLANEKGLAREHMKHRFSASYVYTLPWGQGRQFLSNLGGVGEAVLGGWELSGIVRMNSGSPHTPTLSINNSGFGRRDDRPNLIGDPKKDNPHPTEGWWNPAAFAGPGDPLGPAPGEVGNAGKGSLIGPGFAGWDFSLLKRFNISEEQDLQFRFEVFNFLNQANFFPLNRNFGSRATPSASFGTTGTALDSRQIQFGLKYLF